MFLLDTMVLSESFKLRPDPRVLRWLDETGPQNFFVSVITLGEIESGIEKRRRTEPPAYQKLEVWLADIMTDYKARTLPVTTATALRWGRMVAVLQRRDMDVLIAATALEHDLTVATRNVRHFEPTGAKLFNPYEA